MGKFSFCLLHPALLWNTQAASAQHSWCPRTCNYSVEARGLNRWPYNHRHRGVVQSTYITPTNIQDRPGVHLLGLGDSLSIVLHLPAPHLHHRHTRWTEGYYITSFAFHLKVTLKFMFKKLQLLTISDLLINKTQFTCRRTSFHKQHARQLT